TGTGTGPAACGGVSTEMEPALAFTGASGEPAQVTVDPAGKLPLMVTGVPPSVVPFPGLRLSAGSTYLKDCGCESSAFLPLPFSTMTSTMPAACAGVRKLSVAGWLAVAALKVTSFAGTALPPTMTALLASKPLPLMVTVSPPAMYPSVGLIFVTTGWTASGRASETSDARSASGLPLLASLRQLMPGVSAEFRKNGKMPVLGL